MSPELEQVQHQEAEHDETEHEHVLRSPFNGFGALGNRVSVVATSLAVLPSEPECKDDVQGKTSRKDQSTKHSIPVGTEELAHGIIPLEVDDAYQIHQCVESEK